MYSNMLNNFHDIRTKDNISIYILIEKSTGINWFKTNEKGEYKLYKANVNSLQRNNAMKKNNIYWFFYVVWPSPISAAEELCYSVSV